MSEDHVKSLCSPEQYKLLQARGMNWQQILAFIQAVISALANVVPPA